MAQLTELNDKQRQIATAVQFLDAATTPYTSQLSVKKELVDYRYEQPIEIYRRLGFEGVMDGRDVQQFNSQTPDVMACHSQKFGEGVGVSDFTNESASATVKKRGHLADQVNKAIVVLKHSQEASFCSGQDSAQNDEAASIPHRTRGIFAWAKKGTTGFEPLPAAKYATPAEQRYAGPLSGVDDKLLQKMGGALFTSRRGGQGALKLFAGIGLKQKFYDCLAYQNSAPNNYVNSVRVNVDGKDKEIVKIVDFVQVDGVTLEIHPTAFNLLNPKDGNDTDYTTRSGFAVDMNMVGIAYQRLPMSRPIENKGGGPRAIVDMISMHVVKNPKAILTFESNSDE